MSPYAGIDLHANNNYLAVIDETVVTGEEHMTIQADRLHRERPPKNANDDLVEPTGRAQQESAVNSPAGHFNE